MSLYYTIINNRDLIKLNELIHGKYVIYTVFFASPSCYFIFWRGKWNRYRILQSLIDKNYIYEKKQKHFLLVSISLILESGWNGLNNSQSFLLEARLWTHVKVIARVADPDTRKFYLDPDQAGIESVPSTTKFTHWSEVMNTRKGYSQGCGSGSKDS